MSEKRNFPTKRLVTDAVTVALFFVLSLLNVEISGIKITFCALPVLVSALLFGPADGFIVGLLGAFLEQMLRYGFTPTTVLWILPPAIQGLLVGVFAKKCREKFSFALPVFVLVGVLTSALNTAVYYVDSKIFGYYTELLIFGMLIWRLISGAIVAGLTGFAAWEVAKALTKAGWGKRL